MTNIDKLKRQARDALIEYRNLAASADCGNALLQNVSLFASDAARRYDAAMRELSSLDPARPAFVPLTVA